MRWGALIALLLFLPGCPDRERAYFPPKPPAIIVRPSPALAPPPMPAPAPAPPQVIIVRGDFVELPWQFRMPVWAMISGLLALLALGGGVFLLVWDRVKAAIDRRGT